MSRQLFTTITLVICTTILSAQRHSLRILYGHTDTTGKYPYVVSGIDINSMMRSCTGSLITSTWVLIAAHCSDKYVTHIQYGNMSMLPKDSKTISRILKVVKHPGYLYYDSATNDIVLWEVVAVPLNKYGKLSTIDYSSLIGHMVEYAGLGETHHKDENDYSRPLQVGEGVVVNCGDKTRKKITSGPFICVAPKCSNKWADSAHGDSGGPVIYDNKIIGITCCSGVVEGEPVGMYTPVSPYLTWIQDVVTRNNEASTFYL